ncbi:MAG TPA: hypothetical protein VIA81_00900 [Acidimicrobiia bacterium]
MQRHASGWYWTDDLARVLHEAGKGTTATLSRWISEPAAIRGEGEPLAVAEALLAEESDESNQAA